MAGLPKAGAGIGLPKAGGGIGLPKAGAVGVGLPKAGIGLPKAGGLAASKAGAGVAAAGPKAGAADAGGPRKFRAEWGPIVSSVMMRSPPCQLADIVSGCQKLVQVAIPDEVLGRIVADYNETTHLAVPLESEEVPSGVGVVTSVGRDSARRQVLMEYSIPCSSHLFTVDHLKQIGTQVAAKVETNDLLSEFNKLDAEEAEPFRHSVDENLQKYVTHVHPQLFGEGVAGTAIYNNLGKEVGGDVELHLFISSCRGRPQGNWSGHWRSTWKINFVPGQATPAKLQGSLVFECSYLENANTNLVKKLGKTAIISKLSDPDEFGVEVAKSIKEIEDQFHASLEECLVGLHSGPLKALRRQLPLAKERFDWRPLRHAFVRDMKEAAGGTSAA
eukprot:TRINITY_DN10585_c0_g1_i1.p1 TRINITY_DN10585_c0_g1~~TRINITY_DN10585_c0_g1_i1.p1  ORF type:complete len:388 (+),score=55.71 TRINITY_DN10585_c0_g1_i1:87-1250(+)